MRERLLDRLPEQRTARLALAALAGVLLFGAGLRFLMLLAQRPALLGYPDSQVYLGGGGQGLFGDVLRPSGYPLFLRVVGQVDANLSFTTLVQHGLGLAAALLLFLAARRAGAGRWWAVLPAAVVGLGGTEVFLEHAALTEGLFAFVQAVALYAAVRAAQEGSHRSAVAWALLAGLVSGYGAIVRTFGLALVPLVGIWLLLARRAPGRWRRLVPGAVALVAGLGVIGAYVVQQERKTGFTGYTQAGNWNLYGRAATFAKCSAFTPPPGTRELCERTPPEERPGSNSYIFDTKRSPAGRRYGPPFFAGRRADERVGAFARAAFLHQPLDWISTVVTEELPRFWDPQHTARPGQGLSADALITTLSGPSSGQGEAVARPYWSTSGSFYRRGLFASLGDYERVTRVQGPLMVLLVLLGLVAPFAARAERRGAILLLLAGLAALLGPPLTLFYDARYTVPALGPLAAAAAVGGSGLWALVAARRAGRAEP